MLRTIAFLAALACAALALAGTPTRASAQSAAVDCALVGLEQLGALAGTPVSPPDETSAGSGICFFAARAATQDTVVSYALVRPQTLPQRTAYFAAQSRLCAGISPDAPRAGLCAIYAKLAAANGIDGYFDARTQAATSAPPGENAGGQPDQSASAEPDASMGPQPVPGLGDRAVAPSDGLIVQRGSLVIEIVVRRQGALALDAETKLAQLLLERIPSAGS
ncbi:MAG: hypothetical protein ACLPSH_12605 [Vulcanimicrobiaceae bacterium]